MVKDPALRAHQEWLGYLQPVGLVVSPHALLASQAHVNKNIVPEHRQFLEWVDEVPLGDGESPVLAITDLPLLLQDVFDWEAQDLIGGEDDDPLPDSLEVTLSEYDETLRPTYAVKEVEPEDEDASPWLMLIQVLDPGANLDELAEVDGHRWQVSHQARFERLLRENEVPIGLLVNGMSLRLVYAPRGETSGYLTFPVKAMSEVAGRPIFAALHMLLRADRLFSLPRKQRLPAILAESRKYQNEVSTKLSEQVLNALYELLRGFQAADDLTQRELMGEVLREDPNHVYAGLLTVLLRLVFILYAEDRGLLSDDQVYLNHYSVSGLFKRLRDDAARNPDTMDQRYGAWAQLLTLFRLIHDGASHGGLQLPSRHGYLFDPDRYNFLEGRPYRIGRVMGECIDPPMVSDGVIFRVLRNLMILDGERISYRTLDVEQIGSVYETMMGFDLQVAKGRSIAVKPTKSHGAPVTINLEELLEAEPGKRAKWIRDQTDQKITGNDEKALKDAETPEAVVAALGKKVSIATPNIVPAEAMILQPSDERRRTGSHYTPRSLTEPIVRTTLRPILEQLGEHPTPEKILDLKICDPAVGSGAFLVEACRQLGDELVEAWHVHDCLPYIPADEDEVIHARRLIAQRCLYGVDKNPLAADLAKLSLWLATMAKDHALTFLDHAFRHGDSLVGLTREQIGGFHWEPSMQLRMVRPLIEERVNQAVKLRGDIQSAGEEVRESELRQLLRESDEALDDVRLIGDLVTAAFFMGEKHREREQTREVLSTRVQEWLSGRVGPNNLLGLVNELREGERPVVPFHWEIEFPEVFGRENPGFDAMVGNPPFAGKNTIINSNAPGFLDWLKAIHENSHGNSDLVAHFYRRSFNLLRNNGAFGLIATNTIRQGDTRSTGLRWICNHGGTIYTARRRQKWPGRAAVVVSVVHICKGEESGPFDLDGHRVPIITAFLFHAGGNEDPVVLRANPNKSFTGCYVLGIGFTFDDTDTKGVASSIAEMHRLIDENPRNAECIFPFMGGSEINDNPIHTHHRYVINFEDMIEEEARQWPDLMSIIEERVKPERMAKKDKGAREKWWQFLRPRPEMHAAIRSLERMLVISSVSSHLAFAFKAKGTVFSHNVTVIALDSYSYFCVLQSRVHEIWVRLTSSTLGDGLGYRPTDCFETFPFPMNLETHQVLEEEGRAYYEFRAELMLKNDEGLTKTYNRFHDRDERSTEIHKLRELHAAMDRAVLDTYGWADLEPTCEFLLDYEEEEDEKESGRKRKRKEPWRYRWPGDFHDEVLGRLLDLNQERAEEERISGAAAGGNPKKSGKRRSMRKADDQRGDQIKLV